MFFWRKQRLPLALAAVIGAALIGCGENIEGGASCPILCPDQQIAVRDTVLEPIALDTSLTGFPGVGEEPALAIQTYGDTAKNAVVIRFDTLPETYRRGTETTDREIDFVENPRLLLNIDTANTKPKAAFFIDAYDVDTVSNDTVPSSLIPLFRPNRLLGSIRVAKDSLRDTLSVPLSALTLLQKIRADQRLRIGLLVRSDSAASIRLTRNSSGFTGTVDFDPAPDTVAITVITPQSKTPTLPASLQAALTDHIVILIGSPPVPAMQFSVGGLPARRAYLRFNIPARLLDSSTVVRASLELTQVPSPSARQSDTMTVAPFFVGASSRITDLARAAQILEVTVDYFRGAAFSLPPNGSGARSLEMVNVLRRWSVSKETDLPRAIVLRSGLEGIDPAELRFYSSEAPAAVRPKLRITYVPGVEFGLP